MNKYAFLMVSALALAGCASGQLNYNTLDIASTAGDLQTQQVLYNLAQFKDNPYTLPAQIDLSAGSASTNNSITPTVGAPFNAATGLVTSLTNTVSAAPSTASQAQATSTRAASTVSLIASDAWAQNWSFVPITNSDELRRLRSLYAFALGDMTDRQLIKEYPLVKKTQPITYSAVKSGSGGIYCPQLGFADPDKLDEAHKAQLKVVTDTRDVTQSRDAESKALAKLTTATTEHNYIDSLPSSTGSDKEKALRAENQASSNYNNAKTTRTNSEERLRSDNALSALASSETTSSCNAVAVQTQVPDEQFLREPSCVICLPTKYSIFSGDDRQVFVNPRLSSLKGGWLLDEDEKPSETAIRLGHFGKHQLYLRARSDQRKLSEFTLFALTATEESTASVAVGSGGGGSSKKPQVISSAAFASSPAVLATPFLQ